MTGGPRGGWPEKLGNILSPALERLGSQKVWSEAKLRKVWMDVVGEQVASHAHVRRLKGDSLEVDVDSDSWATELTYLAPELVTKLNAKLGEQMVKNIVVQRRKTPRQG